MTCPLPISGLASQRNRIRERGLWFKDASVRAGSEGMRAPCLRVDARKTSRLGGRFPVRASRRGRSSCGLYLLCCRLGLAVAGHNHCPVCDEQPNPNRHRRSVAVPGSGGRGEEVGSVSVGDGSIASFFWRGQVTDAVVVWTRARPLANAGGSVGCGLNHIPMEGFSAFEIPHRASSQHIG